jgi:hypothetical protein
MIYATTNQLDVRQGVCGAYGRMFQLCPSPAMRLLKTDFFCVVCGLSGHYWPHYVVDADDTDNTECTTSVFNFRLLVQLFVSCQN